MKNFMNRKPWLMAVGVTLLTGTTLITTIGCSSDYRVRPAPYRAVYSSPYDYYYYPNLSVYFHISTGYYYYRDGINWRRVRQLPPRFYLDSNDRVRIVINSREPYSRYREHRIKYTPHPGYRPDLRRNQIERKYNQNRHKQFRRR